MNEKYLFWYIFTFFLCLNATQLEFFMFNVIKYRDEFKYVFLMIILYEWNPVLFLKFCFF